MSRLGIVVSLGLRYLFGQGPYRKESLRRIRGGVLGIALSLVPLVLVYEMASGMIEGISSRYLETWSYHAQLSDFKTRNAEELMDLAQDLAQDERVVMASPEVRGNGLLRGLGRSKPVLVRGIDARIWEKDPGMQKYMTLVAGEFVLETGNDIVLGEALASAVKAEVGSSVKILSYAGGSWSGLPRLSIFTVRGIVKSGYQDLDRLWAFTSIERAIRVLAPESTYNFVGLKFRDAYALPNPLIPSRVDTKFWDKTSLDLRECVAKRSGSDINFWALTSWYESQKYQLEHFTGTRSLLLLVMVLIVLVASVNVSSTMILMVVEKQHDLAMLKSLGARRRDILGLFLLMGLLVGFCGAILGLFFGILFALGVNQIIIGMESIVNLVMRFGSFLTASPYDSLQLLNPEFYLEHIPVQIHIPEMFLIFILTIVLSFLASFLPALRAARLLPVEIMRKV